MADNILTRKLGPLPGWGWGAVGIGAFLIWKYRQNSAANASSSTTTPAASVDMTPPAEPTASLQTPGGFNYSGPASYLGNPSLQSLFSGATAATAGATSSTPQVATQPQYLALTSPAAIKADLASGVPVYQSGQTALAYDLASGTPSGQSLPDPNAYYQLSAPAATALGASGGPVYVKAG